MTQWYLPYMQEALGFLSKLEKKVTDVCACFNICVYILCVHIHVCMNIHNLCVCLDMCIYYILGLCVYTYV